MSVPEITVLNPRFRSRSNKTFPARHYRKRIVQLFDSDRNKDIGHTHEMQNQGWEGRKDLEGRDGNIEIFGANCNGSHVITKHQLQVDMRPEGPADWNQKHVALDNEEPASYVRTKQGRGPLLIASVIDSLGREHKRLRKVLEYLGKGYNKRRIAGLMKIKEAEAGRCMRELKAASVWDRDLPRDSQRRFVKR